MLIANLLFIAPCSSFSRLEISRSPDWFIVVVKRKVALVNMCVMLQCHNYDVCVVLHHHDDHICGVTLSQ